MSLAKKRRASSRPPMDPERRALLEKNPHTRKFRGTGARPWTADGRSAVVPDNWRVKTSGHVAQGSSN